MANVKIEIALPASIMIRKYGVKDELRLDVAKLPPHVIAQIFEGGVKVMLTNAWNGGGKDKPEADRVRQVETRLKAWYSGEYVAATRGDSWMTRLKDQFVAEQVADGRSVKAVEKAIADLVHMTFGEKAKATFGVYLDAVATHLAKEDGAADYDMIREEIEAALAERADKADADRAKMAKGLDVKGLALAAFRK